LLRPGVSDASRQSSAKTPYRQRGAAKISGGTYQHHPNKAAHIGHLRNAVLGDTFVPCCALPARNVEVQNYIDNTGVQVADVVVGFLSIWKKKTLKDVEALIHNPSATLRITTCWDLLTRACSSYMRRQGSAEMARRRPEGDRRRHRQTARPAELIFHRYRSYPPGKRCCDYIQYDLLAQGERDPETPVLEGRLRVAQEGESHSLRKMPARMRAAGLMIWRVIPMWAERRSAPGERRLPRLRKKRSPQTLTTSRLSASNGTVTYVGKDIAYHLWKLPCWGEDFGYSPFHRYPDGHDVWRTTVHGQADAPPFGRPAPLRRDRYAPILSPEHRPRLAFHTLG